MINKSKQFKSGGLKKNKNERHGRFTAFNFDSCIAKPQLTSPLNQTTVQAPSQVSGSVKQGIVVR
jgi:hypothetical protein